MWKQAYRHLESCKQKKLSEEVEQGVTVSSFGNSVPRKKLAMSSPRSNYDEHWH